MKAGLLLALLIGALLVGCTIRWKGRDLLGLDPTADMWVHHSETGSTNPPPAMPMR